MKVMQLSNLKRRTIGATSQAILLTPTESPPLPVRVVRVNIDRCITVLQSMMTHI